VVIAAANYDGREEWNQIATALRKLELPVSILALVSDAALKKEMEKTTWDGNVQLKAQFTGDKDLLLKELGAFSPNIVHFFCHGTADPDPLLLVETRNIRLGATDDVPITLSSGDLEPIVQSSWFWLAVLNCCQGSKASAQLPSLARELVQKGAPTVIAMRESVAVADAQLFTEEFYPALVDQLNSLFKVATLVPEEEKVPVEELVWIRPLHAARWRLATTPSTRQPASAIEWTYPVIYVNRDELCLRRGSPVPALADDERRSLQDQLRIERTTREAINRGGGGPGSTTKLDEHIAILEKRLGL